MANPDNIVSVTITVQDASVTQTGFGTPMVLTHEDAFGPELVRQYATTTAAVTDGHSASGATVAALTAIFAQNPRVKNAKVGRRNGTASTMTRRVAVASVLNDTDYSLTINGTEFSFTSDATATAAEIAAGLDAAINAGAEPVTSTDNLDGTFDLTEDVDGDIFGLVVDGTLLTQDDLTLDGGIAAEYAAVKAEDNDFYGVMMTSSATLEIAALAAAVEADLKIFVAQSADDDILSDTAGNLAETLNAAAYNRTALIFSRDNLDYANGAWMGLQLAKDPGSSTWNFKTLSGVTADTLTDTQISNVESNEANHYTTTKGINMTGLGTMASGRFIDVTRGIDWLQTRMQERIVQLLANSDKIPYTDVGAQALENEVRAQLAAGVSQGVLASDPEPTVSKPLVADVSSADRAARIYGDIEFSATLAGAIHTVNIQGTVSV